VFVAALPPRDPGFRLEPLDDGLERTAHESVLQWVLEQSQRTARRWRVGTNGSDHTGGYAAG
jgi:hypothetical protein